MHRLKIGSVEIKDNSWICIFGCYHNIQDSRCECDCHNKFKISLYRHELGSVDVRGVKHYLPRGNK